MKDWRVILTDAAARNLTAKQLAKEQRVGVSRIYQVQGETGVRLRQTQSRREDETWGPFTVEPCTSLIEEWRAVVGWEGQFEVSSLGRVRNAKTGDIRKPHPNTRGYLTVSFYRDGRQIQYRVNRLVARAFVSNPTGLPEVNHKDLDKDNNAHWNMEWATHEGNCNHAAKAGVMRKGCLKRPNTRLSDADVIEMRRLYTEEGWSAPRLGKQFGVNQHWAYLVATGKKRPHAVCAA